MSRTGQQGSLLLDFLQAAVIVGAVTTIFLTAFQAKMTLIAGTNRYLVATAEAVSEMERIRAAGGAAIRLGEEPAPDGWHLVRRFEVSGLDGLPDETGSPLPAGLVRARPAKGRPGLLEVEVAVLWRLPDGSIETYRLTTLLEAPQ